MKDRQRAPWRRALLGLGAIAVAAVFAATAMAQAPATPTKVLKMQASWPASSTIFEQFQRFALRVDQCFSLLGL